MPEYTHNGGTPTGADVTPQGIRVMTASVARKLAVFTNSSDVPIYLALITPTDGLNPAVVGSGIYLSPQGGAYEINMTNLHLGEVWAIHGSTGYKRLCIQPGT